MRRRPTVVRVRDWADSARSLGGKSFFTITASTTVGRGRRGPHKITLIVCRPRDWVSQLGFVDDPKRKSARKILAANVRRLRLERGLSQEALAALADIHRNYLGGIERSERNVGLDNLEAIANALGLSISALLDERAS